MVASGSDAEENWGGESGVYIGAGAELLEAGERVLGSSALTPHRFRRGIPSTSKRRQSQSGLG